MNTRITSNLIHSDHEPFLSLEDKKKMLLDYLLFGIFCYEVITDNQETILEVKYYPVIEVTA